MAYIRPATREFTHAVTGRSIVVAEGSRTERLVETDKHWTEDAPKKEGSRGSTGNGGRRRGGARKAADGGGEAED